MKPKLKKQERARFNHLVDSSAKYRQYDGRWGQVNGIFTEEGICCRGFVPWNGKEVEDYRTFYYDLQLETYPGEQETVLEKICEYELRPFSS